MAARPGQFEMTEGRLAGRSAVITGAGDGIGRGMATRFAAEGAAVLVADFDEEKGREATEKLRKLGATAEFVRCDVTERDQVEAMVAACADRFGSVDILVNNAYRGEGAMRVEAMPDERFAESL